MTTHTRTRNALAEIPARMGLLRVSTPDLTRNMYINDHVVMHNPNISLELNETSATSPDEFIIRQRGRRRVTMNWSPDRKTISPLKTPTKNTPNNTSLSVMTLRSSPRKRLLTDFSHLTPEKLISPRKISSPIKNNISCSSAKKLKYEETSVIRNSKNVPLNIALKGLTQEQLISIIQNLVNDEPELEEKIKSNFPTPDLKPMEEQIIQLKKTIYKSLPSTRLISKTDSAAFQRASMHVANFKKTVVDQSRLLHDSQNWDALLDYSIMAWNYVRTMPSWDNYAHNTSRRHCFKVLSWHCLEALRYGGLLLGENRLIDFSSRIKDYSVDCEDINSCLKPLNLILNHVV